MAYETGIPNSHTDLLSKLATWLTAIGWTINKQTADELYIYSNDISGTENLYFSFKATVYSTYYYILITASTGFDGGLTWDNQPGKILGSTGTINLWGICPMISTVMVGYWFFGDKDFVSVVVEPASDYFSHMCFGKIEKAYSFTGGQVCSASRTRGHIQYDLSVNAYNYAYVNALVYNNTYVQGNSGGAYIRVGSDWQELCTISSGGYNTSYLSKSTHGVYSVATSFGYNYLTSEVYRNVFNQLSTLHTPYLAGYRTSDTKYAPIGKFKNIRIVSSTGVVAKQSIYYGSDEYMVFPMFNITYSQMVAIKKVA